MKLIIKRMVRIFFSLLILLSSINVYSQDNEGGGAEFGDIGYGDQLLKMQRTVIPPSPNAASLGSYGEFNADLYTGALQLQFPLGGLSGNNIAHSVALSYNSSSYMADQRPSWTGASWTLNAGGVISRTVRGNPDSKAYFYDQAPFLSDPLSTNLEEKYAYYTLLENNCIDVQPDLFNLTVGNLSCQFIITNSKDFIISNKGSVKSITPTWDTGKEHIVEFTVQDYMGNTYVFSDTEITESEFEDTKDGLAKCPQNPLFYSSWFLSEITNVSSNQSITFHYDEDIDPFIIDTRNPEHSWSVRETGSPGATGTCKEYNKATSEATSPFSEIQDRKFLQRISLNHNGNAINSVIFKKSRQTKEGLNLNGDTKNDFKLDTIEFLSGNKVFKIWDIKYHGNRGRMLPSSLQESSPTESIPAYNFEYPDSPYASNSIFNTNIRDVRIDQRAGNILLGKVTYPTGGYSEYEFERHVITDTDDNTQRRIAGNRITSAKKYDKPEQAGEVGDLLDQVTYEYLQTDDNSSGIVFSEAIFDSGGSYENGLVCALQGSTGGGASSPACTYNSVTEFNYAVNPVKRSKGSHVGYSRVVVHKDGYTEYLFENKSIAEDNLFGFNENGNLLEKIDYDSSNDEVRKTVNIYSYNKEGLEYHARELRPLDAQDDRHLLCISETGNAVFVNSETCDTCVTQLLFDHELLVENGVSWSGTKYTSVTSKPAFKVFNNLESTTITDYFPSGNITKEIVYEYDDTYNLMSSKKIVNNDDKDYEIKTTFLGDYALPYIVEACVDSSFQQGKWYNYVGTRVSAVHHLIDKEGSGTRPWELYGHNLIKTIDYDADKFPDTETSFPGSNLEVFDYDFNSAGLIESITNGKFVSTFIHNSDRTLEFAIGPDGLKNKYTYDDFLRLDFMESFSGADELKSKVDYEYNYQGLFVESTSTFNDRPDQVVTEYFDGLGRPSHSISRNFVGSEDVTTAETGYDTYGRPISSLLLPGGSSEGTKYEENPLGRVETKTYPDGAEVEITYDATTIDDEPGLYYKVTTKDEKGNETYVITDKIGRTIQSVDAKGGITKYTYFDHGKVETITSPEGQVYRYTYDDKFLLESKTVPGMGTTTFVNNDLYQVESSTDPKGVKLTHAYDEYGRQTTTTKSNDNNVDDGLISENFYDEYPSDQAVSYEGAANAKILTGKLLATKSKILGENGYTWSTSSYDGFGRVTKIVNTNPQGKSDETVMAYNNADEVLSTLRRVDGVDITTANIYDTWSRIDESYTIIDGQKVQELNNKYFSTGLLKSKNLAGLQSVDYHYNDRGWIRSINQDLGSFVTSVPLPSCEEIPSTMETTVFQPVEPEMVSLSELLNRRFDLDLTSKTISDPCPPKTCLEPGCSQMSIEQQYSDYEDLIELMIDESTITTLIPCVVDGVETTREEKKFTFEKIQLPLTIHRLRLCDNTSVYLLDDYLSQVTGSYEIDQTIVVEDESQLISVELYVWPNNPNVDVQEMTILPFLDLIFENPTAEIIDAENYIACGERECTTYEVGCSNEIRVLQLEAIEKIEEEYEYTQLDCGSTVEDGGTTSSIQFPVTLHEVALCDGSTFWVTEAEWNSTMSSTGANIVDTKIYDSCDDSEPMSDLITPLDKQDLFCLQLDYEANGNIQTQIWQVAGRNVMKYGYVYDPLNRILDANFSENVGSGAPGMITDAARFSVNGITYSPDGNIQTLNRNGINGYCAPGSPKYGPIDNLVYTYDSLTNRLESVKESVLPEDGGDYGLPSIGQETPYGYDANGNITFDPSRNATITYNYLNLPSTITSGDVTISYLYDASGVKWKKTVSTTEGTKVTDYIGGVEYVNDEITSIFLDEGRAAKQEDGWQMEYVLRDHLGNTRIAFSDVDGDGVISNKKGDGEILQEHHIYPFGMSWESSAQSPWYRHPKVDDNKDNNYQYNGKELQDEVIAKTEQGVEIQLGYYDYGARFYDPAIGRFMQVDPLSESMASWNPYVYTYNNPLKYTDPDGRLPILVPILARVVVTQAAKWAVKRGAGIALKRMFQGGVRKLSRWGARKLITDAVTSVPDFGDGTRVSPTDDDVYTFYEDNDITITPDDSKDAGKTVDDILEGAVEGEKTKGKSKIYEKEGGLESANEDFDALLPENVKDIDGGRVGDLPSGQKAIVREKSSDGRPTLEIQNGKKKRKIRYRNEEE